MSNVIDLIPRIEGVRSAGIYASEDTPTGFRIHDFFSETSWQKMAEHTMEQCERYAKELGIARRNLHDLQVAHANLQRRNRELEKRDLGLAEVLMSFVNFIKGSK